MRIVIYIHICYISALMVQKNKKWERNFTSFFDISALLIVTEIYEMGVGITPPNSILWLDWPVSYVVEFNYS